MIQSELQNFQTRLERGMVTCQDEARDAIPPGVTDPNDARVKKAQVRHLVRSRLVHRHDTETRCCQSENREGGNENGGARLFPNPCLSSLPCPFVEVASCTPAHASITH